MTVRYSRNGCVEMALQVKKLALLCLCRIMERSEIIDALLLRKRKALSTIECTALFRSYIDEKKSCDCVNLADNTSSDWAVRIALLL